MLVHIKFYSVKYNIVFNASFDTLTIRNDTITVYSNIV